MPRLDCLLRVLSWLGRQGPRAVAALVVIGIALPPLGRILKPFITETIFLLLCFAFMQVDIIALRAYLRKPAIILSGTAWTALVVPLLVGSAACGFGLPGYAQELFLAIMLQAIASPIMSAPALASLIGLDAALVLATLITSTALIPLTAPLFAQLFIGPALSLSPLGLGSKLGLLLAGSALTGFLLRRLFSHTVIQQHSDAINGCNIFFLFVFVVVIMENVAVTFAKQPLLVIELTTLACAAYLAMLTISTLLFWRNGRQVALALGFMTAQRNMGLMLAATGSLLPQQTWLYFALAQFPIYFGPYLLKPLVRHLLGRVSFSNKIC